MESLLPTLAVVALMTPPPPAGDVLRLQRFDSQLRATEGVSWEVGGRVAGPVLALPGGEFAAVVEPASGTPWIGRWDASGRELRRLGPKLSGPVVAAHAREDGAFLVVTGRELVLVRGEDGNVLARRQLPAGAGETLAVAAADTGAWIAYRERLVHAGLDGRDRTRSLPAVPPPLAQCKKEYGEGRSCSWETPFAALFATRGGCLLAEAVVFQHDASGPSLTRQVALSRLDAEGGILAQETLGEAKKRLEWFYVKSSPGNPSPMPGKLGLVRRRWDGVTYLDLAAERPGGDLLVLVSSEGKSLVRLSPSLERRWSRPVQPGSSPALSPAWAKGIFLYSGGSFVHAFDEDGGSPRAAAFEPKGYDPSELRAVAGQTPAGDWLLVSY